jgi:hypothetical protein
VPAYQWLWSEHDESLHHKRRYTATELSRKASLAGFKIRKRSYAILFSFGLIVGYRFINSIFDRSGVSKQASYVILPRAINKAFIYMLKAESRLLTTMNFPFGTSVLIILTK